VAGAAVPFVINISLCRPFTDFGQGFYVTTNLHQARQWANAKVVRTPGTAFRAPVLAFQLNRDQLAEQETLCFVRPIRDFWDLVHDCRNMWPPHQRTPRSRPTIRLTNYDVVYGPVTLWPSILTIQDCDQISFHTQSRMPDLVADPVTGRHTDPPIADIAPVDVFPT
jgi:hypothetical protein